MNENPFAHSDELVPPPRRFGVGSRVMWFMFGFAVCFVLCTTLFTVASYRNYQALGPQDYSRLWPAESPETKPEWLEHAKYRVVNGFGIVAAEDAKSASAMVWPISHAGQMTMYDDADNDGHLDWIRLLDRKGRSVQLKMVDASFRSYDFTPNTMQFEGGATFYDYDLDGMFDCKVITGNKTTFWLMVDSQWCPLIPEGNQKGRVEINGEWKRAVLSDDQWRLE